jgi:hypothetical protein
VSEDRRLLVDLDLDLDLAACSLKHLTIVLPCSIEL